MPEIPDFEEIAKRVAVMSCEACAAGYRRVADGVHYDDARGGATWGVCRTVVAATQIAERLREVWNARGSADIATFDTAVAKQLEARAAQRTDLDLNAVVRALRSVDR